MLRAFKNSKSRTASVIDTSELDQSLDLLKTTTMEVSKEAVNAARFLEQRLYDSEFRFFSTIDAVSELIIVKDGEGRWQTVNRHGQMLFCMVPDQYKGKTNQDIIKMLPHMTGVLEMCNLADETAWNTKQPHRYDQVVETDHGTYYFDMVKTPIFHPNGARKELITIGRDVTEVREKQRRTKACFTALNSASDLIVIVDAYFNIFFCNDRFAAYFDIGDYESAVGESLAAVVPNIPNIDRLVDHVENNNTWEAQYDGRYNFTVLPMMNGVPKPIYYVFTFKEIGASCGSD